MKLGYLKQDCDLTLKEGLELHYSVNPKFKKNVKLIPEFYNHDIVHVLFGLDTSPENEALADTRCIFSTNWGLKQYISDYFRNPNAIPILKDIMKEIGFFKTMTLFFTTFPKMFRVYIDSKRMTKLWRINPNDILLDVKLSILMKEYNITVINFN